MVGALSAVGSSMVDSHVCPCLCLDALSTTNLSYPSGDRLSCKSLSTRRISGTSISCSMRIGTSLTNRRRQWRNEVYPNCKRPQQRKERRFVIVNELAGQYEDSFEDVKTQILNYFTYKAVRTVLNQLYEMNPTQYTWFYNFVATNKPAEGKHFIRSLGKEKQDLAERVMVTRLHLYGKWVKKCNHAEIYQEISDENLALMRERLMETVIWPSDDSNPDKFD